uniref:Protein CPL1-like domain-containing protein n=1 Tax=Phakopsora pachyrhizi TaxID=170000 RepID=A0A0S1MJE2_PHAPC
MVSLSRSIGQIKSTALTLGHSDISSKCDEALSHLKFAQSSWQGISSGFLSQPWNARRSPHASVVQGRLSSCSGSLEWIYRCPRFRHPLYQKQGDNCRVWNWPSPPNNGPKPSGGYGGGYGHYRRNAESSMCPSTETACLISNSTSSVECLDTQKEITSCGGCASEGQGENCMFIEGAEGVGCESGKCVVFSTKPGYIINEEGRPEIA